MGFFVTSFAFSQVGIGTTMPNTNSILELLATNKGLLLPRVALTGTANAAPLAAHVEGMNVYNTATAGDVTPGMYVNNGTGWVRSTSSNIYANDGTLAGNRTVTQDAFSLDFSGGNIVDGFAVDGTTFSVDALNNRVGIGTAAPAARLAIGTNIGRAEGILLDSGAYDYYIHTELNALVLDANGDTDALESLGKTGSGNIIFRTARGSNLAGGTGASTDKMIITNEGKVGVGTTTPGATLQVTGIPATTTVNDGITFPTLTGDQLSAKTEYAAANAGTVVYVTAADATPSGATVNVTAAGLYYLDGTAVWRKSGGASGLQKVVLNAEYDGAVLNADGSNNSLNLNTKNFGTPTFMNYYEANNFNIDGGTNDYDVIVRYTLPSNFSSWAATNPIQISFQGTADASIEADVFEAGNATALQDNAAVAGTGIVSFGTSNVVTTSAPLAALVAGDTMVIRINLTVTDVGTQTNSKIRIGDITVNYN